jgi:hypothetical protein
VKALEVARAGRASNDDPPTNDRKVQSLSLLQGVARVGYPTSLRPNEGDLRWRCGAGAMRSDLWLTHPLR